MKIIWSSSLVQRWFAALTEYTGAEIYYSIVMDYDGIYGRIDEVEKIIYVPIRRYNNVDVPDSYLLLCLTYLFGTFSELHLPPQQHMLKCTEEIIQNICDHFNILFLPKEELDVQTMKIDRFLLNDSDSTRYHVGDRVIKKFSILTYTITDVAPLINDRRNITLSSEHETLVLDEEDVIRNYHLMAGNKEN